MTSLEPSQTPVICGYTLVKEIGAYSTKTHFLVKKNDRQYAMKLFTHQQNIYFQKQSNALEHLHHTNIINMIEKITEAKVHLNYFNNQKSGDCSLIVTEIVPHGNICECLQQIKYCTEDVTRTLIKQLLEALIFSKEKNILHGPIKGYDILIDEKRSIKLSGWAQSQTITQESLRKVVFSIGQIIILMLTGHPPFVRHNQNDPLFKFINQKNINRFWDSIEKRIKQKIAPQIIDLCNQIFLNQKFTLEDILKSPWVQKGKKLELSDLKQYFKQKQDQFQKEKQEKQNKIAQQNSKFDKIRQQMSQNVRSVSSDHFLNDYYACNLTVGDLKVAQWTPEAIEVKQKLSFVVAWIKKVFKDSKQTKDSLIYPTPEMYLHSESVQIQNNQLIIKLQFMNHSEEEKVIGENETLQANIQLFRDLKNRIYALVKVNEENTEWQNEFYVKKLKRFIEHELHNLNCNFETQSEKQSLKKQQSALQSF